ncbi:MAG: UDP-glucose/GDP-mannose dehydrogenase family protein [Chloroflexota bacterium]|nr:UDP-glucose/GDP-mannose dehydrogenase family protein [Chloroflexota bacterium]
MRITVIGMGHLGIVAASALAREGHHVTGVDVDSSRIEGLKKGKVALYEPGLAILLKEGLSRGNLCFRGTEEFSGDLGDVALVATGTPSGEGGEAGLSQVISALHWIRNLQPRNTTIVMKSTVPPGSGLAFAQRELKGLDVAYVSNPEFLREGRALQDWMHPDRIVAGVEGSSRKSVGVLKNMYAGIEAPYLITDVTSAEMLKYASNAFLATRISFVNEMAALCEEVGASIDAVSQGLAMDARTGQQIHAGIGYGGSCFPKDILAIQFLAHAKGMPMDLLHSVAAVNERQRRLPLARLRSRFPGGLAGVRVGVLGVAFKPGTSDIREAAAVELIEALDQEGAEVTAFDPQANCAAREALPASVTFCDNPESAAVGVQALVLLTEWDEIVDADWACIAGAMQAPRFVFDGRNALDAGSMVNLGFDYVGVGRRHPDQLSEGLIEFAHNASTFFRAT